MTKIDVLDDVIEMLIRKAMDAETKKHVSGQTNSDLYLKGEKENGLSTASSKRKPTYRIQ